MIYDGGHGVPGQLLEGLETKAMSTQHSPIKSLDTKGQESFPGCQCSIYIVTHFFLGKLDIVESTTASSVLESLLDPVLCASSLGWLKSASFHYNKSQP